MEHNKDGSDDSARRLTDEFGRHKLTDNSTILTEDTDSFIIGQRVWVGGTKPGSIAYIGETQFAPGDWAGIVLDQPIGKNDGSVGGIRYFQCEPKKGVFSRLTRLTRYPLGDAETSMVIDQVGSTPVNGTSRRSPISPTGSMSPLKSPPSLTTSNTSLTSAHIDFKLGDRVIIKSSQGSKIGTLRFMGCTEFAAGEWCGVELDEPRGKNDGSVGGKRYFDCRPNFGLFAPVSKVSKSPSNRKPGACVIHSGPGLPPSGFRRANSKESLTSNTSITSAASGVRRVRLGVTSLTTPQRASPKTPASAPLPTRTALQEVLKEKQQHIEQLLKERDLERAEIAKAASQADEAEQKYVTLKQEFDFYRLDAEKRLQDHVSLLTQLKNEMKELLSNLEDEKRKNEDLQFRFEEAAIAKADLEQKNSTLSVSNEMNLVRITELENQLSSERQRLEALEGDSNKLFEAEEALVRTKEENEALKYEIEVAAKKIQFLESEGTSNKDLVSLHQKELEDKVLVIKQKDEIIEKVKTDIKSISDQYEQSRINFTKEIEEYKNKINTSVNESTELKAAIESLRSESKQLKDELNLKSVTLLKTIESTKELEDKLNKEIDKLKMIVSGKNLDLENANESLKKKDNDIKELASQLTSIKSNLESQSGDLSKVKNSAKEVEDNLRKELEESRASVKLKINEVEEVKKELAVVISRKEAELKESNKTIKSYLEDIEKLNSTITEIKTANSKALEEKENSFVLKLNEFEEKNQILSKALHEKDDIVSKFTEELTKLQSDISTKSEEIKAVQNNLDLTKTKLEEETSLLTKTNEELNQLRLKSNDLERKLKTSEETSAELLQQKSKLEEEVRNLVGSSGDYSNRLNEISNELQEKDKIISNIKNELTTKLQEMERSKEEIQIKYETYVQKSEKDLREREEAMNNLSTSKIAIKEEFDKTTLEYKSTIDGLNGKLNVLQKTLEEKDVQLKKLENQARESQEKLKIDTEKTLEEFNSKHAELQKKLDDASKDNQEVKDALSKKSLELIEMESRYNQQVELAKQNELEIKSKFEENLKYMEHKLTSLENEKLQEGESSKNQLEIKIKEMEEVNDKIKKEFEEKLQNLRQEKDHFELELSTSTAENTNLKEDLEKSKAESSKVVEDLTCKVRKLEDHVKEKDAILVKLQGEIAANEAKSKDEISKLSGDLHSNILVYQKQVEALNKDKEEVQKILASKEEEVQKTKAMYEELIISNKQDVGKVQTLFEEEKKNLLEQLNTLTLNLKNKEIEIKRIKELNKTTDLSTGEKIKEIEQLKTELQINHSFIERLQSEKKELLQQKENLTNSELDKDKQCVELNKKLIELSEELKRTSESSFSLQTASNLYVTILQLLKLSEEQKIDLVDQLNSTVKASVDQESYTKLCKVIDGIKIEEDDSKEQKIKYLEREVENYKHQVFDLESKLRKQESQIPRPTPKTNDVTKIVNNGNKADNSTMSNVTNNNPPATNEQLMEEKLLAESQVAFLNAIIVDMQKKNEEQKARIEILESGYSPAAADELGLLRLSSRNLPPRMYCDICEEFDLHETEDCPQQANEDMPAVREKSPKDKPPPRPYCEICEVFGHATEDCQEDQTF